MPKEGQGPRLFRARDLAMNGQERIQDSASRAMAVTNQAMEPIRESMPMPVVNGGLVAEFANFLNDNIYKAMETADLLHLMATSGDPFAAAQLRRRFLDSLKGESSGRTPIMGANKKIAVQSRVLGQDPHFTKTYLPGLEKLNEIAEAIEVQLLSAQEARRGVLGTQDKIASAYLKSASGARKAGKNATDQRVALDKAISSLMSKISTVPATDIALESLVKSAQKASKGESDSRVKEAMFTAQAGNALSSLLPAMKVSETVTSGQVGLILLDQMTNAAFLFGIAAWQDDVSIAMEVMNLQARGVFGDFMAQATARREQMALGVTQLRAKFSELPGQITK